MQTDELMAGLPGEDLVRCGLADAHAGRLTVAACLVQMARPRLAPCGLLPPLAAINEPELELYRLLKQQPGDAYARYNALLGELVSFEMAFDRRLRETRLRETRLREEHLRETQL